jgi:hypothetical protein
MKAPSHEPVGVLLAAALVVGWAACSQNPRHRAPPVRLTHRDDVHLSSDSDRRRSRWRSLESDAPHGAWDGRVADLVPNQADVKFGPACEVVALEPVTITFSQLPGGGFTPFGSSDESGFTITATVRAWEVMGGYGNPMPSIIFRRQTSEPDTDGEVRITSNGAPFVFTSVDIYSSVTPIPYVITGAAQSREVLVLTGRVPNTFGHFAPVPSPTAVMIDALVIRLTNPATLCCGNPVGIDNVSVKR